MKQINMSIDEVMASYRSCCVPSAALRDQDITHEEMRLDAEFIIESLSKKVRIIDINISDNRNILKIYNPNDLITVSFAISGLENFGCNVKLENSCKIIVDGHAVYVHKYDFSWSSDVSLSNCNIDAFKDLLLLVLDDKIASDKLNQLSYLSGFGAMEIMTIKSYIAYMKQIRVVYAASTVRDILIKYYSISTKLMDFFKAKFAIDINEERSALVKRLLDDLQVSIAAMKDMIASRVLGVMLNLMIATLRTNCFVRSGFDFLSFKFRSKLIENLPKPVPFVEVFVFSEAFEAIHLRAGRVARGGIRWSSRVDDYRTEVLGLMKTQIAKNSIIIPTGSKGGFFVKRNVGDVIGFGIECYKNFLRGMFDVTDNIVSGKIIKPVNVIAYDEDDPYLVVAADKGTATFSDYANKIANDYNFWLGDAFASGGSNGYDHKKIGITAKGVWEGVKRHFTECGIDINKPFTAIGIGGPNGDVFGNGVIYSEQMLLIAAFNHEHIFIDPYPDIKLSYKERMRLFKSVLSWGDYDLKCISSGGGVFNRFGDDIVITPEMGSVFNIDASVKSLKPEAILDYILKAKVDLLWNGGIGTFVKAKSESNSDVSDAFNDSIRINGADLGARVVGEGGNLGITQLGRIEYEISGGHVNTDAIDNSAGVDCSDHEVNIKIALNHAISDGFITLDGRNSLLSQMAEEVEMLVLRDNYLQTQAIGVAKVPDASDILLRYKNFIIGLENLDLIDRSVEYLPDDVEITRRLSVGMSLTRPELAILLNYGKIYLSYQLAKTNLDKDAAVESYLISYFPMRMRKPLFEQYLTSHPLRDKIIITAVSNEIVNRIGITAVWDAMQIYNVKSDTIIRSYIIVKSVFHIDSLWLDIDDTDGLVDASVRYKLYYVVSQFVQRAMYRLLTIYGEDMNIEAIIADLSPIVNVLRSESANNVIVNANRQYFENIASEYMGYGVSGELARSVAAISRLRSVVSVASIAHTTGVDPTIVAGVYYEVDSMFDLLWIKRLAYEMKITDYWEWCSVVLAANLLTESESRLCADLVLDAQKRNLLDVGSIMNQFKSNYASKIKSLLAWCANIKSSHVRVSAMINLYMHRFNDLLH